MGTIFLFIICPGVLEGTPTMEAEYAGLKEAEYVHFKWEWSYKLLLKKPEGSNFNLGTERTRVFTNLQRRKGKRNNAGAGNARGQNRVGNVNPGQAKPIKCYKFLDEEQLLFLAGEQVTNFDDDKDDPTEQDLALNVDHVFEADQLDAFDMPDVDDAPLHTKTMFIKGESYNWKIQISMKSGHLMTQTLHLRRLRNCSGSNEKQGRQSFELTEENKRFDEQIMNNYSVRNRRETSLKSETLYCHNINYLSILDQYKSKTEEVTILKKNFKQTEDKHIEEFLDMKKLKDKSSALYNGTEIVMTNHKPAVVHDSKETLEIAELTRKRMYEKMKSPLCIQNKVKFAPPDYSKENYLAIFAPQRDLTHEQIFWAKDENDRKKVDASVLKPLSTLTVYLPNTPVKLSLGSSQQRSQVK
ncbi:hypothetical protein Tco_0358834 [Tanacetum coccineum]